ncbi:hypothetical protein [Nostocoides vanveenii]|uniref:Uncharacterized protein n=1 Tax=Nostocoides vanveenii TaxID=330835 RepID=A0ABP4X1U1_9MICO
MTTLPGSASMPAVPPDAGCRLPAVESRFAPLALAGWILLGVLAPLSILGILTIGIFVAPTTLGLLAVLLIKAQPHARAGTPIGAGVLLLWVAWNMRWVSAESCSGTASSAPADGTVTVDPCTQLVVPWGWLLLAGAALATGSIFLVRDMRAPGSPPASSMS